MNLRAFFTRYRVDDVPVFWKPLFYLYGCIVGALLYIYFVMLYLTCRKVIIGREYLSQRTNYIFCCWHTIAPYMAIFIHHRNHIWMNHAGWYMKHIHVMLWLAGVRKLALGSSGEEGKKAVTMIVQHLQQGWSTVIMPDGPYGPRHVLKKGVLHMSLQSGVPILPMRFQVSHAFVLSTWDHKMFPYPFSKITAQFDKPIHVSAENFEVAHRELEKALAEHHTVLGLDKT